MVDVMNAVAVRLQNTWYRIRDEETAQGLVEYALIIVVVSLGTIAALTFLRGTIRGLFSSAGSSIRTAPAPAEPNPHVCCRQRDRCRQHTDARARCTNARNTVHGQASELGHACGSRLSNAAGGTPNGRCHERGRSAAAEHVVPVPRRRDAQGLVEYALIIVVVSLGTIAALTFLRGTIRGLFSSAGSSIQNGAK